MSGLDESGTDESASTSSSAAASSSSSEVRVSDQLAELLADLPLSSVRYAFAYGSGVVQQRGEQTKEKMVDFILVTRDALAFHQENLIVNRHHYSTVRYLGARALTRLQTNWAARVFYNTNVRTKAGRLIKYGVITSSDFRRDLLDWPWLYVSGRLHKPVVDVLPRDDSVAEWIRLNRSSALHAALLQLPDKFTLDMLLNRLVGLSYRGDFRMALGEDKHKISKIVDGQREQLLRIYRPLIDMDARLAMLGDGETVEQDGSTPAIYHRLNLLPQSTCTRLTHAYNSRTRRAIDAEEVIFHLAHQHDVSARVGQALESIVAQAAIRQTTKNALTAGLTKSVLYAAAKLLKMGRSMR